MQHRAWRFHEYGGSEVVRLETLEKPEAGPGEVLVKVRAAGLNRSDLLWTGAAFFKPDLPSQLGAEICGTVESCGEGVTRFAPGDRVSNLPIFTRGAAHAYSQFAEYTVLPEEELIPTPAALSDVEGAAFLFTNLTQMCALTETVHLRPGQVLLVTAGTSANGLSAILLGKHLGATVIATTRSAAKRDFLLDTGADAVIVTSEESLSEQVARITGGQGADIVYDCVGGALTTEILQSIRPGGDWIMYGFLDPSPFTSSWPEWFARQPTLHVFALTQYTGIREMGLAGRPNALARAIAAVEAICASGAVPIPVAQCFDGLESIRAALELMESDKGGGKIVVRF